jgi:hypothetical protein
LELDGWDSGGCQGLEVGGWATNIMSELGCLEVGVKALRGWEASLMSHI